MLRASAVFALLPFLLAGQTTPVKVLGHQPGLGFVRFNDPGENAFSLDVPRGWRTNGGLVRHAPTDVRTGVESISPDGAIRIAWGDAEVPSFTIPNQILAMTGFREGSWYSPGYGVRLLVRRYEPGAVFAEDYVRNKLARQLGCSALNITSRQSRDDLTQAINRLYAQFAAYGQSVREDAGEVAFDCTRNGQPYKGYFLAATVISANQNNGIWAVDRLIGYTAPVAKIGIARAAMLHLASSMRQNPEWVRMQSGITMSTSQIVAQTNQQISSTIRSTFENKWKTEDRIFRHDANARRGQTDVVDPDTGETWNVQGGANYYWRKPGSDVIVGTNTYDPPTGYQPLHEY